MIDEQTSSQYQREKGYGVFILLRYDAVFSVKYEKNEFNQTKSRVSMIYGQPTFLQSIRLMK